MKKIAFVVLAVIAYIHPLSARAADFDGSRNLICASIETAGCVAGEKCLQGSAEMIGVPQFVKVNFKSNQIDAKRLNGEKITAKIITKTRDKGQMILQGVNNNRSWSLVISEKSGKMSLTASGDQVVYVVFGACIPSS